MTFPDEAAVERERIRKVLEEHRLIANTCRCGFNARLDYYRYESHVAAALVAAASVPPTPLADRDLWDLANDILNDLNIEDENPPSLIEVVADRIRNRFDTGASVPHPNPGEPSRESLRALIYEQDRDGAIGAMWTVDQFIDRVFALFAPVPAVLTEARDFVRRQAEVIGSLSTLIDTFERNGPAATEVVIQRARRILARTPEVEDWLADRGQG